jgi:putative DNA primase/helicase
MPALAWGCSKTYLHDMKDGAALASHLREAPRTVYGTAARAYLEQLAEKRASNPSGLLASTNARRQVSLDRMLPAGADGQVISVCRRFSLIAVAGEMATNLGIVPWKKTEAFNAVAAGFMAWLKERGGIGPSEDRQAVRTVRRFLEQHGESRFGLLVPSGGRQSGDDEIRDGRDVINRVGFRRETSDGWEFLIFPESWKQDVCKGLDPGRSAAALDQAGLRRPRRRRPILYHQRQHIGSSR